MYDDYPDHTDRPCPKCGEYEVLARECDEWDCEDGYIDEHGSDPINYAPGEEYTICTECWGTGHVQWCRKCGCDVTAHDYKQRQSKA